MPGSAPPGPPEGPGGLIVIIRDDPIAAARALATDLRAPIAIGGPATERALGRLGADPEPQEDQRAHLDRLAAAMRRAEAVSERTRAAAAEDIARSINTGLAIHPDTLQRAADELLDARADLDRARRRRSEGREGRRRRARAGGSGGLTVVGVALGTVALPVGAAVAAVGVVGAVANRRSSRRAVAATVPAREAREAVARRRWEQLAGPGADPADVAAVIHRYDPQHRLVANLVAHHPAVRAAERVAAVHRAAWVQGWRDEVGDHVAPVEPTGTEPLEAWAPPPAPAPAPGEPETLVVASPYAELTDEQARDLHGQLLTLPPGRRVIVVLGPDAHAERAPVVDLTDPPPAIDLTEPVEPPLPARPVDAAVGPRSRPPLHHQAPEQVSFPPS